ncbi:MAG: hypothetical protein GY795_13765, partial [Desulfobacterales bacterium]|nr:hypothetical protein [Desulfobacterales bacterium]
DPVTGRKDAYINAMTKTTRYLYNDRGQATHTWGEAAEPVKFVYDSYGRMTEMHTFRGGSLSFSWSFISMFSGQAIYFPNF